MHAVRKRILEILKETGGATVAELAEALDMAPVSVRHHLDILQGDNLICVDRLERKGNVGRPQQVYGLTEDANSYFPNDFAALSNHLVRQIKQMLSPEQVQGAFCAMASEIAAEFTHELEATDAPETLSLEERLTRVTDFLNQRGYLARWEATTDDGEEGDYLLHKHNCPYAGVSDEHSELCLMDQTLINTLLDRRCERSHSMAQNERCCTYVIHQDSHLPSAGQGHLIPGDQIELASSMPLQLQAGD
ncbi:MAG: helix-turn-helix domain-containing protein [Caldilineaceae bacterium]|nr:helix-turn-helix domain-containing protein [Caldilineaceae bacterium]